MLSKKILSKLRNILKNNDNKVDNFYKTLFDVSWDAIFIADAETGRILDANKKAEELIGRPAREIIGTHQAKLHPPEEAEYYRKIFQDSVKKGEFIVQDIFIVHKDGYQIPVEISARITTANDRKIFLGIFRNMNETRRIEKELKKFKFISDNSNDAHFFSGRDAKFQYVNKTACKVLGYSENELLTLGVPDVDTAYDLAKYQELFDLIQKEAVSPVQSVNKRKDGTVFPSETTVTGYQIDGKPYILAALRDITKRRQAEEELRESEELYRTLFEQAADSIVLVNPENGALVDFNDRAHQNLGYTREEFKQLKIADFELIESPEEVKKHMDNILQEGSDSFETRHRTKEGEIRNIMVSARALSLHGKNFILSTWRDFTGHKQAEEKQRESEERYRSLVENIDLGIVLIDTDYNIVMANTALGRILKKDISQFAGGKCYKEFENNERVCAGCPGKRAMETLVPQEVEIEVVLKDGSRLLLWIRNFPVFGPDDSVTGFIEVVEDITDRKRIEKEKKKLEAQIRQAQKMEVVDTLAGGIAHDLNNLLQPIIVHTELLLMNSRKKSSLYQQLKEIKNASYRAAELISQLLVFSRKMESEFSPVDLNKTIRNVKKLLARTIPKMIGIELQLAEDLRNINADPNQIEQVLINLAVNARDAMPDGGKLTITTDNLTLDEESCKGLLGVKPGDYVLLTVSDTGCGMDRETREHIFEPFYSTKVQGKGTGLGLAMVYGIVMNHQGHINCHSAPGQGTTFHVYWPATQKQLKREKIEEESPEGGTETIMVVDDEKSVLECCRQILTGAGYQVVLALDCKNALKLYRQEKIDLVVLDLILPETGGKQCLESLLQIDNQAKIIIASGYFQDKSPQKIMEAGAKAFIRKPYNINQFLTTIRKVLDEKSEEISGHKR